MRTTVRQEAASCTGCGACVSICPKQAITMRADGEGFLYPVVDGEKCVECSLCEKRCPAGKDVPEKHAKILGAQAEDAELRKVSSSGGVFTLLARDTLAKGGVVFGAAFDENLRVEHVGALDETELAGMRGSKYVQSDATDAIQNAVSLLGRDIPVLFSGAPCQINGLLAALGRQKTDKLLTVDFVCHGVPSPGVFASYIRELEKAHGCRATGYAFRDKRLGWKNFSAVATFEDGTEHTGTQVDEPFLYGFLQNLYLRPACHVCTQLRGERHPADITIADLWGAEKLCPEKDDDTGLSLVMANTQKGRQALEALGAKLETFPLGGLEEMARGNPGLLAPAKPHEKRAAFFKRYRTHGFESRRVMKLLRGKSRFERALRRAAHLPVGLAKRILKK